MSASLKPRALIIGAGGFVGNHLFAYLSSQGVEIYRSFIESEYSSLNDKVNCFSVDICNYDSVYSLINEVKPDFIYNLAGQASVGLSWKKPQLTMQVNCLGFLNIVEAAKSLKQKCRILAVGSSEEYGEVSTEQNPISEDIETKPSNPYSISKFSQYMLADLYCKVFALDIVIVRAFNHIGPGQSDAFVVSDFAKRIVMMEKGHIEPKLFVGNLNAKRDFTDVRDIVRAYYLLMQNGKTGHVYNVGSNKAYKIEDILNLLLSMTEQNIIVETDKERFRPIDVELVQCDNSKIYGDTGWKPEIDIKNTLSDVLNYWRNNV